MAKTTSNVQTALLERVETEVDKRLATRTVNLPKVKYMWNGKEDHGELLIGGNIKARIEGAGERQLLDQLQIPGPYWGKIDPELRVVTANHLLKKMEDMERNAYILDGKQFLGFQLSQRPVIKGREMLENVFSGIPGSNWDVSERDTHFDPYECRLSVFKRNNHEIKKNDIVKAGVSIFFSPIGDYVTRVEQYAYRLVCTNGMTAPTGMHTMTLYGKDDVTMFEKVKGAIEVVWNNVEAMVEGFKDLVKMKVKNPQEYLEHLFKVHHLPPAMRDYVRDAFEIEPGDTMWHITNAFTRAANDDELVTSHNSRKTLQSFGGSLATRNEFRRCGTCGHHLN